MTNKYVVPVLASLTLFDIVGGSAQAQETNFDSTYIGAAAGYQFNDVEANGVYSIDLERFIGGVFGGHNFRFGNLVLGIEGGVYGSEKKTFNLTSVDGSIFLSGLQGEARGRVGFVISDGFMIYGAGGAAFGKLEVSGIPDEKLIGYLVGGGLEAVFTSNLSGRVDVTFTDFGDEDFGNDTIDTSSTSVKAGIVLNF